MLKPSLQLKLGQQLTMTPQLQQAIRLLQLPNGSGVKQKLSALQDQVATLRDDASRKEILTN